MRLGVTLLAAVLASCQLEAGLVPCGDLVCAQGDVCLEGRKCISTDDATACLGTPAGTACSTARVAAGVCGDAVCIAPGCGNGVVETNEMCDDGNTTLDDGCSADCLSDERCGNGVVDFHEACDDGNHLSADGCSSTCTIEDLQLVTVDRPGPHSFTSPAMVYASAQQQLVHFSGDKTWIYEAGQWRRGPDGPSSRGETAMAYDPVRQKVVLYGGGTGTTTVLRDTWEYDGVAWTEVTTTTGPFRRGHSLAYDPVRQRIVMFGGRSSSTSTYFNDTWTYDGASWAPLTVAGTLPPRRQNGGFAFDASRQALVLVSGQTGGLAHADMWTLDATSWTQVSTTVPSTGRPSLAYDATRARLVLYARGPIGVPEIWEYASTGWVPRTDAPPLAGNWGQVAYDDTRGVVAIVAGDEDQHWEVGATWTRIAHRPGRLADARIAFDIAKHRLILHGGAVAETWAHDAANGWRMIAAPEVVQPPSGTPLVYDSVRRQTIAVADGSAGLETWVLEDEAWTKLQLADAPPRRERYGLAFDRAHERVVLFGGKDPITEELFADTWVFANNAWSRLETVGQPDVREAPPLTYDATRGRVVLAGGIIDNPVPDTWELEGSRWIEAEPLPSLRGDAVLTYDPVRRSSMLLAGWEDNGGGDEDVLEYDGVAWTYGICTPAPAFPSSTYDVTYDPFSRAIVAIGVLGVDDPWALGYFKWTSDETADTCTGDDDLDGDELRGCADPDCFAYCDPSCPPGATCPDDRARCGDGSCDAALETHARCAEDCP
ncbi:MAG TPA: DUF4215 domain-containing protein [Kofleriaceae bacterium]|nr:DUF4215 domain-containing protein [Kofleriaceae bacterium]